MNIFKRQYTAGQLQAMVQAYRGKTVVASRFIIPAIFTGIISAFTYLLLFKIFYVLIFAAVAAWYSYVVIVPHEVSSSYYRQSYTQRWKAITTMAQSLSNKNNQAVDIVQLASERVDGEFRTDLEKIVAVMTIHETPKEIHQSFEELKEKYFDDDIFKQFMEQIEIFYTDGIIDEKSISRMYTNYNQSYEQEEDFVNSKLAKRKGLIVFLITIFGLLLMLSNGMSFANWTSVYTTSGFGTGCSIVCIVSSMLYVNAWSKNFYNDNLTMINK